MNGIGSPKLTIKSASPDVMVELEKDNYPNKAYVELRPKGICIYFRSLLETFSLSIPFYKLSIYNNGGEYSIYGPEHKLILASETQGNQTGKFFNKVIEAKSVFMQDYQLPEGMA